MLLFLLEGVCFKPSPVIYTDSNSLDKRFGDADLTQGSHDAMDKYGRCYIQIKKTHENMPYGFVQYEVSEVQKA